MEVMKLRIVAIVKEDLARTVSRGGFSEVFVASNKAEALELLEKVIRKKEFDLVVLDDALAAELGKGTLSRLKYENPFPAIVELKTQRAKRTNVS